MCGQKYKARGVSVLIVATLNFTLYMNLFPFLNQGNKADSGWYSFIVSFQKLAKQWLEILMTPSSYNFKEVYFKELFFLEILVSLMESFHSCNYYCSVLTVPKLNSNFFMFIVGVLSSLYFSLGNSFPSTVPTCCSLVFFFHTDNNKWSQELLRNSIYAQPTFASVSITYNF